MSQPEHPIFEAVSYDTLTGNFPFFFLIKKKSRILLLII